MQDATPTDLNESALTRALSSERLRALAISLCGMASGLTISSYLILGLATIAAPHVPKVRPDIDAAAGSMALALGIGVASALVVAVPRPWRWLVLLCASGVQFAAAAVSIPFLF